jgi:putative ABC transport system permease protein
MNGHLIHSIPKLTGSTRRDSLVVFQFMISILLIAGTMVITRQMKYMQDKPLGYQKDHILVVERIFALALNETQTLKLILAAFLLAVPLTWYIMSEWLQGFAYRIEMGAGIFVLSGLIALFISWLTVSYQSIKAARMNPVKSLRSE